MSTALVALGTGALAWAPPDLPAPEKGLNLLVVGLDSREGVTAAEKKTYRLGSRECSCTDVMMLVHVSAKNDRVSVLSLPRDSLTGFHDGHVDRRTGRKHESHPAKINSAWAEGGSSFTIETVEAMTGLQVHRYLEIDFRRFMDTVDFYDEGVPVCTKIPLKDTVTGLDLKPGSKSVRGGEALQFVRSRRADGKMDFGRIQKQHLFLANLHRNLRDGLLSSPTGLKAFATTLRGTDKGERAISVTELVRLAGRLKRLTPSQTQFATVPVGGFNATIAGVGSTLAWDEKYAAEVFAALRADKPLPKPHAQQTSEIPKGLGEYRPTGGGTLLCA
ncbi:LCP family protein [Streptomyces roseicoloratus]|uniref:LCP family protein n=1 Tax=Streptomyces roseicoloratus TaxID=2508722 RepID=A0ABY9RT04_9ACTN|nr:LCP family protein [Streptomyces roseicoloratus]WMX45337.1 LCP family protein [Streptomyces roseicoloratus]